MYNIKSFTKRYLSFFSFFFKWIQPVALILSLVLNFVQWRTSVSYRNFEAKRTEFIEFMDNVLKVEQFAKNKDFEKVEAAFQEMNKLFLGFEPIMDEESYDELMKIISEYYEMVKKYTQREGESYYVDLLKFQLYQESYIYPLLFRALFNREPSANLPNWARENLPKDFNPTPGVTGLD
ncbi:MAG: hypothetical protein QXE05_05430 [Nitrososphaeria archaeon]